MKKAGLWTLCLSLFMFVACNPSNSSTDTPDPETPNTNTTRSINDNSNTANANMEDQMDQTFQGTFESRAGVMDLVSCYCGDGGYLETPEGERLAVCLDDVKGVDAQNCTQIEIIGAFKIHEPDFDDMSPCPRESMKILHAKSVTCGGGDNGNAPTGGTSIEGDFRGTQGVMKRISCFCYESGYITTGDGEQVGVCFKKLDMDRVPDCGYLRVEGSFETIKKGPSKGACAPGEMELLMVESYECL